MGQKFIGKMSTATNNYAQALIETGKSGEISFDTISKDMNTISETLEKSSELQSVFLSPAIDQETKIDILETIFSNKISSELINFLKILLDKKRIEDFQQIYADYNRKLYEINNIQPIKVISAVDLNEEQKQKLIKVLSAKLNKNIIPQWEQDKEIIAGLKVEIYDNVIDMSLKSRLDNLNKSLMLK